MPQPLEGMRVLDITQAMMGPTATVYLSDMGAEVLRVEPPQGDATRFYRGIGNRLPAGAPSPYFVSMARGKKSVVVDMAWEKGREIMYRLAGTSDVVVSNFRRGVMERLGLGYEDLKRHNPRIVWARASGYGPEGPDGDKGLLDGGGQARGGINSIVGEADGRPLPVGAAVADTTGGMQLALAIMTALVSRERHGVGQKVETSSYGGQLWLQMWEIDHSSMTGRILSKKGGHHPNIQGTYGMYETADGRSLFLAYPITEEAWQAFCTFAGFERLGTDPRWDNLRKRLGGDSDEQGEIANLLRPHLREAFRKKSLDDWAAFLKTQPDIVWEKVHTYEDILSDPQAWANQYIVEVDLPAMGRTKVVGNLVRLSETPGSVKGPPPEMGQHTEVILQELGYSWEQIVQINDHNREVMRRKFAELGMEPPY